MKITSSYNAEGKITVNVWQNPEEIDFGSS